MMQIFNIIIQIIVHFMLFIHKITFFRQKNEEKRIKEEERKAKEEERKAKEEEKRKKEEEKIAVKLKEEKTAAAFASFFVAKRVETKSAVPEVVEETEPVVNKFIPFEVKLFLD